jgi:hypothetical protein
MGIWHFASLGEIPHKCTRGATSRLVGAGRRAGVVNPAHHSRNGTLLFRNQGLEPPLIPHDGGDGAVIIWRSCASCLFGWAIFKPRITPYERGSRGRQCARRAESNLTPWRIVGEPGLPLLSDLEKVHA